MDIFSHFVVRIVMLLENTKINEKEAAVGPFFKKKVRLNRFCIFISVQRGHFTMAQMQLISMLQSQDDPGQHPRTPAFGAI